MRICLLSARFPPQRCGVGDYTYFLACALARIGFTVDVLTSKGALDEVLYPFPPSVHVHRTIGSWGPRGLPGALRYLHKLNPQVLVIQYTPHAYERRGITVAVNLLPSLMRAGRIVRVITNFHEMYIPFQGPFKRRLSALWQRAAAVLLASGSHAISVTASEWQRRLTRMGIRKPIHLIPVGSNIPQAQIGEEDRGRLRHQLLGGSKGVLVAVFGARHDRDISAVLYALQQLKRQMAARLVWVGGDPLDGQERTGLERAMDVHELSAEDVQWTGELYHPEVSEVLSVCDLMMLPFIDGVSTRRTSAVTALQHGLPLLTTRGSQPEPWFVHSENVFLIPPGDRQVLADGLLELARRPDLRARLGRGARILYDTYFTWDVIAAHVARLAQTR